MPELPDRLICPDPGRYEKSGLAFYRRRLRTTGVAVDELDPYLQFALVAPEPQADFVTYPVVRFEEKQEVALRTYGMPVYRQ